MTPTGKLYGVVGEFESPEALVNAARAAKDHGYRHFEAYSPYPIKDLDEVVPGMNLVPAVVLAGGIVGALTAFYMQYFIAAIVYPLNVGGRPLNSWPSWVPITFELTVLFASIAAFFSTLYFAGFPAPYHPLFRIPEFKRASDDGFFLCLEAKSALFFARDPIRFLRDLNAIRVWEVEDD
jgi:hypothetical protein